MQVYEHTLVQVYEHTNTQIYKHTTIDKAANMVIINYTHTQLYKKQIHEYAQTTYTNIQIHNYTNIQLYEYTHVRKQNAKIQTYK